MVEKNEKLRPLKSVFAIKPQYTKVLHGNCVCTCKVSNLYDKLSSLQRHRSKPYEKRPLIRPYDSKKLKIT